MTLCLQQLLAKLNRVNISMAPSSKASVLKNLENDFESSLIKAIHKGQDGKLNGDNLDIYVKTNDIRMTNQNKDYHFFASDWTPFRITESDFETNTFLKTELQRKRPCELDINLFQPDVKQVRENIKCLVARQLIQLFPEQFQWMEAVVPAHIEHPLEDIMSRETKSYPLPIQLKNEMKYEDCICILDSFEQQMKQLYETAGRGRYFY